VKKEKIKEEKVDIGFLELASRAHGPLLTFCPIPRHGAQPEMDAQTQKLAE